MPEVSAQAYSYRGDPAVPPFDDRRALFVFDGVCVLCSGGASWLMRFDRRPKVNFTSMQGRWAGRSIAITASSRTRATC